ncbi:hypothetical protein CDAR_555451 [Caerostris darwini]|uniref:Uncharacterized protein n=1 Tax=Caerostris darwini TaxID=1538125 RepID=A0AAV4QDF4_9ARAC|nr:hypothetical protein CDAR_555451 [Caerostris darwini]
MFICLHPFWNAGHFENRATVRHLDIPSNQVGISPLPLFFFVIPLALQTSSRLQWPGGGGDKILFHPLVLVWRSSNFFSIVPFLCSDFICSATPPISTARGGLVLLLEGGTGRLSFRAGY